MTELEEKYFNLITTSDFPYKEFEMGELKKEYEKLSAKTENRLSNTGMHIIENYHKSIWRCNVKGCKSPLSAWYDDEIMFKIIQNRMKYLRPDNLTLFNFRHGLTVSKIAPKVSIFRPALAKDLIKTYLNEFDTIFDPCSGFSGRMLGACCLGKKYIGQDINTKTISEANNLITDFNLSAEVVYENSLYNKGEYDCLFTCPPYSDKENWFQDIEVLSCDEWIDILLKNYNCSAYLFVVDKTEKYKEYVVDKVSNKSHFSNNAEQIILVKNR